MQLLLYLEEPDRPLRTCSSLEIAIDAGESANEFRLRQLELMSEAMEAAMMRRSERQRVEGIGRIPRCLRSQENRPSPGDR